MATVSMEASPRGQFGNGAARKTRKAGLVPALIYGRGQPAKAISIDPKALELIFARTRNPNTLLDVAVDGSTYTCLVREVQRHPVSKRIEHVDLYEVDDAVPVRISVPVQTTGRAEGTRLGGTLQLIRRTLQVSAKPKSIPDAIVIDVTNLDVGGFIKVSEIEAPPGVEILYTQTFNIVTVVGKRGAIGKDSEAPAEAAG